MLEVKNLTKFFKGRTALYDVSFKVEDGGSIIGLIGVNGAGKSTLMKIICSLVFADSGEVLLNGEPITDNKGRRNLRIGYAIESPAFYGELTGRQNLTVLADLFPNLKKDAVQKVIEKVGLSEQADKKYKSYSLGMKQRLHIAYALLNEPELLLLDEPFNGIDPVTVKIFKDLLKELSASGTTIIISSHNILDMQSICDRILMLDKGSLMLDKTGLEGIDLEDIFFRFCSGNGNAQ